jgi:hypothetical protein
MRAPGLSICFLGYVCMCVCCENGFVVCDGDVNKGTRVKYMFSQVCVCMYVCVCGGCVFLRAMAM